MSVINKYDGLAHSDDHAFDVGSVNKIITELEKKTAARLDNLTVEHMHFSHPIVVLFMSKRFNIIMSYSYVPASFGRSDTIPFPKSLPF